MKKMKFLLQKSSSLDSTCIIYAIYFRQRNLIFKSLHGIGNHNGLILI